MKLFESIKFDERHDEKNDVISALNPVFKHIVNRRPNESSVHFWLRKVLATRPQSVRASCANSRLRPSGCSSSYRAQAVSKSFRPSRAFCSRSFNSSEETPS